MYRNNKLVPDVEKAKNVVEVFNMWEKGINYKEIAQKFSIPVSTLYEIVKNPIYIGKIQYRGQLYDASHKPIIEEEQFFRINPPTESQNNEKS